MLYIGKSFLLIKAVILHYKIYKCNIMKQLTIILIMALTTQLAYSQGITNEQTAILVVEFQKTWSEKTFFHKLIKKEYERKNVYENSLNLLASARKNGVKVIQAPLILDKSDKEKYKRTPFPARLFKQFTVGTYKAEYTDGIFKKGDIEVTGRCGFDACEGSNLLEILAEQKIKQIYIVGFTTEHCAAETYDILEENGYKCILVSDCTATRSKKLQKKGEKNRNVMKSGEIIDEIL